MPDIDQALLKDKQEKARKFWMVFGLIFMATFFVVMAFAYVFVSPSNDFFFSNKGQLICVNKKPWGVAKTVETQCYRLSKID